VPPFGTGKHRRQTGSLEKCFTSGKKTIILKKSVGYPVFCCGLFSEPEFLIGYRWSQMDGSDQEITMFSSKIDIG
jgi:hypothetical protein